MINKYFWDEKTKIYKDYQIKKTQKHRLNILLLFTLYFWD